MTQTREPFSVAAAAQSDSPADSTIVVEEAPGSTGFSPTRSAVFLSGLAVAAVGVWIVRSRNLVGFRLPGGLEELNSYVRTYREVVVGGCIAVVGALAAASAVMGSLPDRLAGAGLAFFQAWSFGRGRSFLFAGSIGYAIVIWLVLRGEKSPLVFLLFVAAIAMFGVAVHRIDGGPSGPDLGFRRIDVVIFSVLAVLVFLANLVELTHWRYSFIGDEGAFFNRAKLLLDGVEYSLFDLAGVYGMHPILDSAYLACFLKVFGANIVSWRIAEIVVLVSCSFLVYALVLILFGRIPAVVAAVFVGTNHHLMAFARIGYNNLHCVFLALLVVLFLTLAWRTERTCFTFLTGAAMGSCIYTFSVAMFIWPVVALLVAIKFLRRPTLRELAAVALMIAAFALVVTPGLLTTPPQHLVDLAIDHGHREMALENPVGVARISLVRSFLVFWVNPQWFDHFIGGPILDPISGVLVLIGLALGLVCSKNGAARIGVAWFGIGLLLIAVAAYDITPFFTRLLLLIPACAIFAAMGAWALDASLRGLRLRGKVATGAVIGLTAIIPLLNLHQFHIASPKVLRINPETITVKALQERPGRVIIEVREKHDLTLIRVVNSYPSLRDHFVISGSDELELPPVGMGRSGKLPFYLVRVEAEARLLLARLPERYSIETDIGPHGYPQIWILTPGD